MCDGRQFVDLAAGAGAPILDPTGSITLAARRFNWLSVVEPVETTLV